MFLPKFRTSFNQWCQVTTCAGVIDWHLSKSVTSKFLWSFLLIFGLGITIWQTFLIIKDFTVGDPYQTIVTAVTGKSLDFPNITICNFNRLDRTKIGDVDSDVLSYAFLPTLSNYYNRQYNYTNENIQILEAKWRKVKKKLNVTNLRQLFQEFGYSCKELFIKCQYQTAYTFDCCSFAQELITGSGRCWKLISSSVQTPSFHKLEQSYPGNMVFYLMNLIITEIEISFAE